MRLKSKFIILGAGLIGMAGVSAYLNSENNQLAETQSTSIEVVQRHMDADMKHDGIRGNVYSALLAASTGNAEMLKSSQQEIATMSEEFAANVDTNLKATLPADIKQQFLKIQGSVKDYADYSIKIAQNASNFDAALAMLPKFNQVFEVLEEDQGKASDMILAWSKDIHDKASTNNRYFQWILGGLCVVAIGLPLFAMANIFNPLEACIRFMIRLSEGDTTQTVPFLTRKDEMGNMATTLQVFKTNAIEKTRLASEQAKLEADLKISLESSETQLKAALERVATEQKEAEARAEVDRQKTREELAQRFEQKVQGIIQTVVNSATDLQNTSEVLNKTISINTTEASHVADSAEKTTRNVETIASAIEEMSATVNEIASQMSHSATAVNLAVEQVQKADETSAWLDEATLQIDKIVETINTIASQINLLALNATIESASAGEAGKGFAVVANEVKLLATQTREATNEISSKVTNIKGASKQVIEALQGIKNSIDSVNEISVAVSGAVEQQSIATREISHSMAHAAQSVNQINGNIDEISKTSGDAGVAATKALNASNVLSIESGKLNKEVNNFLAEVRRG
jgi:methyl-accepting chemotaxis protein